VLAALTRHREGIGLQLAGQGIWRVTAFGGIHLRELHSQGMVGERRHETRRGAVLPRSATGRRAYLLHGCAEKDLLRTRGLRIETPHYFAPEEGSIP
jgi:hypothetical protein